MTEHGQSGAERREQQRVARKIPFYCYVDGQRFDTDTLNISASGAFLQTDDDYALKTPVLLLPKSAKSAKPALLVVGHVVRRQHEPVVGIGIQWSKVISRRGLSVIIKLAALLPEMFPEELPAPSREILGLEMVGYAFKQNAFFEPTMPGADKRKKKKKLDTSKARMALEAAKEAAAKDEAPPPEQHREHLSQTRTDLKTPTSYGTVGGDPYSPVPEGARIGRASLDALPQPPEPPDANTTQRLLAPAPTKLPDDRGPVSDVLGYEQMMIPVEFPVTGTRGGKPFSGHMMQVGMQNVFVAIAGIDPMDCTPFEKVEVTLPIELNARHHEVVLGGKLLAISEDPRTEKEGISVTVDSVAQPSSPGLFERYVKYLYYHMINEA